MRKKVTTEEFIEKLKTKRVDKGEYFGYSKFVYTKANVRGIIICPIHGEFEQTPNAHLKGFGCYYCGIIKRTKINWSIEDIDKIKKLYSETQNKNISKILNKPISEVCYISNRLKLKKSKEFKSRMISKRNKMITRDLSLETLKTIALKYKTRMEFQMKDPSAYTTARQQNLLNDICNHMTSQNYNTPQLILQDIMDSMLNTKSIYNDKKAITPHEIDVYYPIFNLALEYQGKHWHADNKQDDIKKLKLQNKNINVIYIVEKSRNYEEDIKNQLIDNLSKINNICKTSLTKIDIINYKVNNVYLKIFNKKELINVAKKYKSYTEFRQKEKSVYNKLCKMKLINEATKHITDKKKLYTDDEIKKIVETCLNLNDLIENHRNVYSHIMKNKKKYLISHLEYKLKRLTFTIEDIKIKIKQYTKRMDFVKENKSMYGFLKTKKLTYLLAGIRTRNRKYPTDHKFFETVN